MGFVSEGTRCLPSQCNVVPPPQNPTISTHAHPYAQVASLIGNEGDATPFTDVTVENISQTLHQLGYQSRGWEVMYNGHTGECGGGRLGVGAGGSGVRRWGQEAQGWFSDAATVGLAGEVRVQQAVRQ
jgi:hypothetical protein